MIGTDTLTLRSATLADGSVVDVCIGGGTITEVLPAGTAAPGATSTIDLDGDLLLPSCAEPHAHLDKAFLAETVPNPAGDLLGAINAMHAHAASITLEDTIARAERAARLMLRNGVTAIRSHADLTRESGLRNVHALIEVRERLHGLVDIQVCALTGWPTIGPEGAYQRALLRDAIAAGVDLVGGCPHLETDAVAANETLLGIAAEAGLPIDLHTDETLSVDVIALEDLARRVIESGFPHAVTASHCVSLGMQSEARQREVSELVAAAGIHVVALPHTNLFLQGRLHQTGMPRGLTAIRALTAAGVNVAAGADNLQDPFNPVGRGDPLETAGLMIMAAHLLPADAYASVSARARDALGIARNDVAVGSPADLVAIHAHSVREAIAMAPGDRLVLRAGRVIADQLADDGSRV